MFADLHLHTCFSDGTFTPEELVAQAQAHGLAGLALTDHDTVEGCTRARKACETAGIEFIAGTELTAEQEGEEIHLLGYFLDIENREFLERTAEFQTVRQNRIREMVERLNQLEIPLTAEKVFALAKCKAPGRPHVARALVADGYCDTMDDAFERFLKRNRPAWVPKFKMSAPEAIGLVHRAGGVAVMAHPGLSRADHTISAMCEAGLDGLECFHTKHPASTAQHYLQLAASQSLVVTGGSDCHGMSKGKPLIGTVKLPYERVERLRERASAYRSTGR